jgi:hypothetical protein
MRRFGRVMRRTLSGLLILAVLLISFAPGAIAAVPVAPAMHHGMGHVAADSAAGMPHDHATHPCNPTRDTHHGMECCLLGDCVMWPASLAEPLLLVPMSPVSASAYPAAVIARPDGVCSAPALPPPRNIA